MSAVGIRMYNVGFGDCFLLSLPTTSGTKKVLIDCGTIKQNKHSTDEVAEQVIADVTEDQNQGPKVDVVIATHRHQDHVGGFANPIWHDLEVKEVWLPWTEDPEDEQAREILEKQSSLAMALVSRLTGVQGMGNYLDMAANALKNDEAMNMLLRGFKGNPTVRYLPRESDSPDGVVATSILPGVTVYVLGPSRDPETIRDMDPPSGESYLNLFGTAGGTTRGKQAPFGTEWQVPNPRALTSNDRAAIDAIGNDLEQAVAVALEKAVNGTSLMLVFKVGEKHFLFPGDAQWGTWDAALKNPRWREILRKTIFYKVGHHGSHNATPSDYIEDEEGEMLDCAMVPVVPRGNWDIPRKPLLEALDDVCIHGYVRSDDDAEEVSDNFSRSGDMWIERQIDV